MATKKAFELKTDLENLGKQWKKLSGLRTREEWSAAIVRAATAAELAANYAIRQELITKRKLDTDFVDNLLNWANGLSGKLDRLLIPLTRRDTRKGETIKKLKTIANEINSQRNSIVHQGEYCNSEEAKIIINRTYNFIINLVQLYKPNFRLIKLDYVK